MNNCFTNSKLIFHEIIIDSMKLMFDILTMYMWIVIWKYLYNSSKFAHLGHQFSAVLWKYRDRLCQSNSPNIHEIKYSTSLSNTLIFYTGLNTQALYLVNSVVRMKEYFFDKVKLFLSMKWHKCYHVVLTAYGKYDDVMQIFLYL